MFILGYSGLNDSLQFRQNELPNLSTAEHELCQGMDAAAVLIKDGKVIAAAEEERFNGEKHTQKFPVNAINFCLQNANITIDDVDYIAHGFDYDSCRNFYELEEYNRNFYHQVASSKVQKKLFSKIRPGIEVNHKFIAVKHHDAHAASAFYPSPFSNALVVVCDGMGELESISIYQGEGNKLNLLRAYDFLSSVGMFYGLVTQHLGFKINHDEYKVMGLAPYGDATSFRDVLTEAIVLEDNGKIFVNAFLKDKTVLDKQTHRPIHAWLEEKGIQRLLNSDEITQAHKDLAAALQQRLNEALLHLLTHWQQKTGAENLCFAGGVALNCTTNGFILESNIFKDIYIQPAAGDAGTALGAAVYQYYQNLNHERTIPQERELPLYGPSLSRKVKLELLDSYKSKLHYQELDELQLYREAAKMIAAGQVIGWMQGPMEFGPRALGDRSILADPRNPDMRDRINQIVKKRECFRPFAPSVKLDKAHTYFKVEPDKEFPYMLFIVPVREEYQQQLPAITHVNGTARIQTVNSKHEQYWKLLDAMESQTGLPIVLNTSFNVKGQPIVATIADALNTFLTIELDALFVGNFKVTKL